VALLGNLVLFVERPSDARINPPKHDVYVNTYRNLAAVSLRAQLLVVYCKCSLGTIFVFRKLYEP